MKDCTAREGIQQCGDRVQSALGNTARVVADTSLALGAINRTEVSSSEDTVLACNPWVRNNVLGFASAAAQRRFACADHTDGQVDTM